MKTTYKPASGTNGSYNYGSAQEATGERIERERFWRSLGKRIRNGTA